MVLVFLTSVGILSAALLSYELAINKLSFSVRRVQTRETGTNTALEWAVNSLRQGKDAFCQGGYDRDVLTVGAREVEVSCRPSSKDAVSNGVALFLNRAEPAELNLIRTAGTPTSEGRTTIVGPVYNGRGKSGWELKLPLQVDGDVLLGDGEPRCEAGEVTDLPENLSGSYTNARRCSMDLESVTPAPVPQPCEAYEKCPDPTPRLLDANGKETGAAPACKVFFPGFYRRPPELAGNNYFVPGTYYFELEEPWRVASAIRGGDPAPASAVAEADQAMSSAPRCEGAPEPAEPWGVTFVFGRQSSLRVLDRARVELFAYIASDVRLPNLMSGGQNGTTEWAQPSNFRLDSNLLTVAGGAPEFLFHSGVFAPESAISFAGSPAAIESINNTVVVGRIEFLGEVAKVRSGGSTVAEPGSTTAIAAEPAEPAIPKSEGSSAADRSVTTSNIGIFTRAGTVRKFLMMARSCPGRRDSITRNACTNPPPGPREQELCSMATATIYDDSKRTVYVDTWRVDRDPSPADPASCSVS